MRQIFLLILFVAVSCMITGYKSSDSPAPLKASAPQTQVASPHSLDNTEDERFMFHVTNNQATLILYVGSDRDVVIPASYKGLPVVAIGKSAFFDCTSLISIKIPDVVIEINRTAFYNCVSLESVVFSPYSRLEEIDSKAFFGCKSLRSIVIPKGVTQIDETAFDSCSSLTSINIPDGVTEIGRSMFQDYTSLTSVTFTPNSKLTKIDWGAFLDCTSLTSIAIPEGVTKIDGTAFEGCTSLTSIKIPDGVTWISGEAFSGCTSLTSIVISSGVTGIGWFAFEGCSALVDVTVRAVVPPELKDGVFTDNTLQNIYVPSQSVDAYKAAEGWKAHAAIIRPIAN